MTTLVVTRGVSTAWLVMGPFPLDTALAPHTSWPGLTRPSVPALRVQGRPGQTSQTLAMTV
jgi:hypothetical protein